MICVNKKEGKIHEKAFIHDVFESTYVVRYNKQIIARMFGIR